MSSFDRVFSKEEIYEIGKYFIQNSEWKRVDEPLLERDEERYSYLAVRLPYLADLSSNGSRVDEMNKLLKEKK